MDDEEGVSDLDLTVTVTAPNGETLTPEYKSQANGRYHVNVNTARDISGEYTVRVADPDGDAIGTKTFTAQ